SACGGTSTTCARWSRSACGAACCRASTSSFLREREASPPAQRRAGRGGLGFYAVCSAGLLALEGDLRQLAAQGLAGCVFRDGINELHGADLLVWGHAVGDPAHELLCPQLGALTSYDECARDLQAIALRADDTDVCDIRVGKQKAFQLGRRDVIALVLNYFLGAVNDSQPAIFSEVGDVAGTQPTAFDESFGVGLLVVQVALHYLRAAHENFAGLALGNVLKSVDIHQTDFCVCHWLANAGVVGVAMEVEGDQR